MNGQLVRLELKTFLVISFSVLSSSNLAFSLSRTSVATFWASAFRGKIFLQLLNLSSVRSQVASQFLNFSLKFLDRVFGIADGCSLGALDSKARA